MSSNYGPKITSKVYKTQHRYPLTTIIVCSAKFLFVKFFCCRALKCKFLRQRHGHILSQQVTEHTDFVAVSEVNIFVLKITPFRLIKNHCKERFRNGKITAFRLKTQHFAKSQHLMYIMVSVISVFSWFSADPTYVVRMFMVRKCTWWAQGMRFNAKELTCLACQSSDQYDKEGVLIVKERQEGLFRKGEGCIFYEQIYCSETTKLQHWTIRLDC